MANRTTTTIDPRYARHISRDATSAAASIQVSRRVDPDHPRDHRPRTADHPCARSWWARGRCGVQVRLHPDALHHRL